MPLRTKVEFSRRDAIVGTKCEAAGREVLRPYGLTPVLATHDTLEPAVRQKVRALAVRAEPQAGDVFDLSLLTAKPDADALVLDSASQKRLDEAIDRAMGLSFDAYASTVVAYLDPHHAEVFSGRVAKIPSARSRTLTAQELEALLANARA